MISEIATNDLIRSGQRVDNFARVVQVYALPAQNVHELQLRHIRGAAVPPVVATAEHLFWVDGRGWSTVKELKPGDWLSDSGGAPLEIVANRLLDRPTKVYTLRLATDNSFYANDVLVHDLCGGLLPVMPVSTAEVSR